MPTFLSPSSYLRTPQADKNVRAPCLFKFRVENRDRLPVILGLFIEQYLSFFEPIAGFPIISLVRQRNTHAIHGLMEKGRQLEGRGQGLDCLRIKAVFVLNPA